MAEGGIPRRQGKKAVAPEALDQFVGGAAATAADTGKGRGYVKRKPVASFLLEVGDPDLRATLVHEAKLQRFATASEYIVSILRRRHELKDL